jgi:hypothetical protein
MSGSAMSSGFAARASLLLVILAISGAGDGIGPASGQATAVFTDISSPAITGAAVEGQTLTEVQATWSAPPASRFYQWQRCNRSGNSCESISKANAQTYQLTAADVGFTIRVGETARDAAGAATPSVSAPTAVVQAADVGQSGGESGGHGSSPSGSCCGAPADKGPAGLQALLARQLAPARKAVSIATLLERGGVRMSFTFPQAGALVVRWYFLSPKARLAKNTSDKPTLVAAGQATLAAGKTVGVAVRLTSQGRVLLKHAETIRLEAKGTFTVKGKAAVSATEKFTLARARAA